MINTCTKFEFNPSTSWGSYARHRHHLLHGARSMTDTRPWHKHTTGELKNMDNCTRPMLIFSPTNQKNHIVYHIMNTGHRLVNLYEYKPTRV